MLTDEELDRLQEITVDEYKRLVLCLFRDGTPTPEQWDALADCINDCAEGENAGMVESIDLWISAQLEDDTLARNA